MSFVCVCVCVCVQVAVDTGTSLMAGPTDVIEQLVETLNVATDCSNYHTSAHTHIRTGGCVLWMDGWMSGCPTWGSKWAAIFSI